MQDTRTVRIVFEFTVVADHGTNDEIAEAVFDILTDLEDAPYFSCDTWDPDGWRPEVTGD